MLVQHLHAAVGAGPPAQALAAAERAHAVTAAEVEGIAAVDGVHRVAQAQLAAGRRADRHKLARAGEPDQAHNQAGTSLPCPVRCCSPPPTHAGQGVALLLPTAAFLIHATPQPV